MKTDKAKDWLKLSATQKRGFLLLCLILVFVLMAPALYKVFFFKARVIDFEKDRKEIESFMASVEYRESSSNYRPDYQSGSFDLDNPEYSAAKTRLNPFPFNPNQLPADQWMKMGFTERQVRSIKNYETKGGRFYSKQDVKKLWAISPEEFNIIEPFIQLPDSMSVSDRRANYNSGTKTYQVVELNSADTTLLKTLPGIGSGYAARIYNYRMKLGGFYSKLQLFEIKGMDSLRFSGIEPYIDINPWLVRKININTATFEQMSSHPYISNNVAISLINYRNRHGKFLVIEDVMKSELVDEELFSKLAPYLTTQ